MSEMGNDDDRNWIVVGEEESPAPSVLGCLQSNGCKSTSGSSWVHGIRMRRNGNVGSTALSMAGYVKGEGGSALIFLKMSIEFMGKFLLIPAHVLACAASTWMVLNRSTKIWARGLSGKIMSFIITMTNNRKRSTARRAMRGGLVGGFASRLCTPS